jgi:hypothetical protein
LEIKKPKSFVISRNTKENTFMVKKKRNPEFPIQVKKGVRGNSNSRVSETMQNKGFCKVGNGLLLMI